MAQWYVLRGDKPVGPFSPEELKTQAVSGQLTRRDMLRKGESGQWVAASHVRGLFVAASDVPPRPAASSANPPSDSRWRERGDRGVEAFRDDEQAVWWYSAGGFMGAACGPLTASRMRELAQAELAFSLAVQELKRRAEALGADAVVGLRTELELDPNDFQYFFLQAYGTAVRFTRRSGG